MFLPQRLCRFSLSPAGQPLAEAEGMAADLGINTDILHPEAPLSVDVNGDKLIALALKERVGESADLQRHLVMLESKIRRENLRGRVLGGNRELANRVLSYIESGNIENASGAINEIVDRDPRRAEQMAENYRNSIPGILDLAESGEITEAEATVRIQPLLESMPENHPIQQAAKQLGVSIATLSSMAASVLVTTKKLPESTMDYAIALKNYGQSAMNFNTIRFAAESLGVEPAAIRNYFGMNVHEFIRVVKFCHVNRRDTAALQQRLEAAQTINERRLIRTYIEPGSINLFQFEKFATSLQLKLADAKAKLLVGYQKRARERGEAFDPNIVETRYKELTIGNLLTQFYSTEEDRNTLASYMMANAIFRVPGVLRAFQSMKGGELLLSKLKLNPKLATELGEQLAYSNKLGLFRGMSERARIAHVESKMAMRASDAGRSLLDSRQKWLNTAGAVKSRMVGGGILLGGMEVYNLATGKSANVAESMNRLKSGFTRIIPVLGTTLDFKDAILGTDHFTSQKLTAGERVSRVGWGILGALADVTMVVPFVGVGIRGLVAGARTAKALKTVRYTTFGAGLGLGVAPLLATKEGREASGTITKVVTGIPQATMGALSLIGGSGGNATDMLIAQEEFEDTIGRTVGRAGGAIAATTENVAERARELGETTLERLGALGALVGGWSEQQVANMENYFRGNNARHEELIGIMEHSNADQRNEIRQMFSENPSRQQIHNRLRQIGDSIERTRGSLE